MKNIVSKLKKQNLFLRTVYFFISLFILAIIYNVVLVRYNIVTGGLSGLAIICKNLFNVNTSIFINIGTIIIVLLGFIFLGKNKMLNHIVGSIAYPFFITITEPLCSLIDIDMYSKFFIICLSIILNGIAVGTVYRCGFSTGGFDILYEIIAKKVKQPVTNISTAVSAVIVSAGAITFNLLDIMYAGFYMYLSNLVTNKVTLGISNNKMVYIISPKNKFIEKYILDDFNTGMTEINVKNNNFFHRKQMLMCIVSNSFYPSFKEKILEIDNNALIITNRCYQLTNGILRRFLPF